MRHISKHVRQLILISFKNRFMQGALIGFAVSIAVWLAGSSSLVVRLEQMLWDWRVRLLSEPSPSTDTIMLILIDQSSLDWAEETNGLSWPWPREVYAPILQFCKDSGARGVALDLVFLENSRFGVEDDQALADALQLLPTVGAMVPSREQGDVKQWPENIKKPIGSLPDVLTQSLPLASFPVVSIANGFGRLGGIYAIADSDGIVRSAPLAYGLGHVSFPSLAMGLFLSWYEPLDRWMEWGSYLDDNHQLMLNYRGPAQTYRTLNAAAIIQSGLQMMEGTEPTVPLDLLKDKYVFLGVSAPGLFDLKSSPTDAVFPGVEIHATVLDNLLERDFMQRFPRALAFWMLVILGITAAVTMRYLKRYDQMTILIIGAPLLVVGLSLWLYQMGWQYPLAQALLALMGSLLSALVLNYFIEGSERRFIHGAFSQYLSPAVIEALIQNPERLKLGGEARILTILFSDIQGFTSISQGLEPTKLTEFLNIYLTQMTDIILEEGGTIDKYEGDAIIAFWNAPLELENHAEKAVGAALKCQKALADMQPLFEQMIGRNIYTRFGLHTGKVVVGNMGSNRRFDYTFIGDAGNLASRLEGVNKVFGSYTCISEVTRELTQEVFAYRELSRIRVVGRSEPVRIYEPFLLQDFEAKRELLKAFHAALQLYYQGDLPVALEKFQILESQDATAKKYVQRIKHLLENLPEKWEGVWDMTEK